MSSAADPCDRESFFNLGLDMMCVTDADGRFVAVNHAWSDALGVPEQQLLGARFLDFVHPDDQESTVAAAAAALQDDLPTFTNRYLNATGEEIVIQWRSKVHGEYIYAIARDITAEVAERNQSAHKQAAHEQLFAVLRQGVVYQDSTGTLIDANPAASTILGLTRDQLLGRTSMDPRWRTVKSDGRPLAGAEHPAMVSLRTGEPVRGFVMGVFHPDSEAVHWIRVDATPMFDDGSPTPTRVYTTFTDITDERNARDAAQRALMDLRMRVQRDVITSLLSREAFTEELAELLHAGTQLGKFVAVLYCDVDGFKHVNDAMSHSAGDELLRRIADRMVSVLGSRAIAGRFGSDEFVAAVPRVADTTAALDVARKLREAIGNTDFLIEGRRVRTTLSVGVALAETGKSADTLIREADTALRHARQRGRNRQAVFSDALQLAADRRVTLTATIRGHMRTGHIHPWFQPIVNLHTQTVVGFESLARLTPEGAAPVPAREWIDVAEISGLLPSIGAGLLEESIGFLAGLPPQVWLTVNASASELADPGYDELLIDLLTFHEVSPQRLFVEITEQVFLDAKDPAHDLLHRIHEAGVGLLLDDFGTGYASLTHLLRFPATGIKLDKSFVEGITEPENAAHALAKGLGDMCRTLQLTTIAEGIETAAQSVAVTAAGWQHGQGMLFGDAQPAELASRVATTRHRTHS